MPESNNTEKGTPFSSPPVETGKLRKRIDEINKLRERLSQQTADHITGIKPAEWGRHPREWERPLGKWENPLKDTHTESGGAVLSEVEPAPTKEESPLLQTFRNRFGAFVAGINFALLLSACTGPIVEKELRQPTVAAVPETAEKELNPKEKEALIVLYKATNGSEWKVSWDLEASPETWYGVEIQDGHVVKLFLHYNQLSGQIPPELGNLENLQVLSLDSNQLSGPIPPEIWSLRNLKDLYLNNNNLRGTISEEITNLRLSKLDLSENDLRGEIPSGIGNMRQLTILHLGGNNFTSEDVPPEIYNLPNIEPESIGIPLE